MSFTGFFEIFKKLLITASIVLAATTANAGDLELKRIMQDLSSRTTAMVAGIVSDDLASVAEAAAVVADHERPPIEERKRILGYLKGEAPEFKAADDIVHNQALALSKAAAEGDYQGVVDHYAAMLKGCVKCHRQFRDRIRGRFYGD